MEFFRYVREKEPIGAIALVFSAIFAIAQSDCIYEKFRQRPAAGLYRAEFPNLHGC